MSTNIAVKVNNITKNFMVGKQDVQVLKGISFEVNSGDFLVVFGPSGCGKSTLLHILLGLESPTTGTIEFMGTDMYKDRVEDDLSVFRKNHIGMIYQQSNWIKCLNVRENVAFPLTLLGYAKIEAYKKAIAHLKDVGIEGWSEYMPTELSSGQQQRVSVARALMNDPEVLIADEPTGNLDYKAGVEMMEIFLNLTQEKKKTVIMVTHDLEYLKYANKIVRMLDGSLVGIYGPEDKQKILDSVMMKKPVSDSGSTEQIRSVSSDVVSNPTEGAKL
jgi:putative ABC transport system ATP-binding protein